MMVYICATSCGHSTSLTKIIMGVQFCTPPPKKDPYKTQHKNGLSAVWRHLSGMPFYKHPSSSYSLVQDAWKHLHGLFLWIISKWTDFWLLWNLFQVFHQLAVWVQRPEKRSFFYLTFFYYFSKKIYIYIQM